MNTDDVCYIQQPTRAGPSTTDILRAQHQHFKRLKKPDARAESENIINNKTKWRNYDVWIPISVKHPQQSSSLNSLGCPFSEVGNHKLVKVL